MKSKKIKTQSLSNNGFEVKFTKQLLPNDQLKSIKGGNKKTGTTSLDIVEEDGVL